MGEFRTLESYNNEGTIGSPTNPNVSQGFTMDRAQLTAILDLVGAQAPADIEILSGAITPTGAFVMVDTEGQAPSDELEIINTLRSAEDTIHDGVVLYLSAKDSTRKVTLVNSASVNGIKTLTGANLELPVGEFIQFQLVDGAWIQRSRANATDEQLESLSQAQLKKLAINAFQFKQIKDPVDYATEHGQIGATAKQLTSAGEFISLGSQELKQRGMYWGAPALDEHNPTGLTSSLWIHVENILDTYVHQTLYTRNSEMYTRVINYEEGSTADWKNISDGSQGMPDYSAPTPMELPFFAPSAGFVIGFARNTSTTTAHYGQVNGTSVVFFPPKTPSGESQYISMFLGLNKGGRFDFDNNAEMGTLSYNFYPAKGAI